MVLSANWWQQEGGGEGGRGWGEERESFQASGMSAGTAAAAQVV